MVFFQAYRVLAEFKKRAGRPCVPYKIFWRGEILPENISV